MALVSSSSRGLWDPYRVLDVYPNGGRGISACVGVASSTGYRCRWSFNSEQFSASQRATAVRQLDSMSAVHPSKITPAELHSLARNTLCRDFHQGQVYAVEKAWRAKIEQFVREHGEMLDLIDLVRQLRSDMTRDREASEKGIKEARQALQASQTCRFELVEKHHKLEQDLAASSRGLKLLRRELTELQANARPREELSAKVEQLERQMGEIAGLKAEVRGRDRALDERLNKSEQEVKDVRQQLAASSREITALQEQMEVLKQESREREVRRACSGWKLGGHS